MCASPSDDAAVPESFCLDGEWRCPVERLAACIRGSITQLPDSPAETMSGSPFIALRASVRKPSVSGERADDCGGGMAKYQQGREAKYWREPAAGAEPVRQEWATKTNKTGRAERERKLREGSPTSSLQRAEISEALHVMLLFIIVFFPTILTDVRTAHKIVA